MKALLCLVAIVLSIFHSIPFALAETRSMNVGLKETAARTALVIGNSAYPHAPLKNPANDAGDMAKALAESGFSVVLELEAGKRKMEEAVVDFSRKLNREGGAGLFYYAGHGIQLEGNNYLIPVDAEIESEADVRYKAVDAGWVLGKMADAENGLNIIILDACRNNPFSRSFKRSAEMGLARMDAPTGSIIAYATAPGAIAADGDGRNGIFTRNLLHFIRQPGIKVEEVLKYTRIAVVEETKDKKPPQTPWESSSLMGNFYFNQGRETGALISQQAVPKMPPSESVGAVISTNESPAVTIPVKAGARKETPAGDFSPKVNSLGMEFVYIKPGSFAMGSPLDEQDREADETQHTVTLTKGYYLQTTEVSQGQWQAVMGNNPALFSTCGDNCPVEQVSWEDTQNFIRKLSEKEANTYRLPTDAEWEYAARAGTVTPFYTGNCLGADQANFNAAYPPKGCSKGEYRSKTVPVKSFAPNPWGLYDMHGNVGEWCQDWLGPYSSGPVTDPAGPPSGSDKILRGGSWEYYAMYCRSAVRIFSGPADTGSSYGFRLVFVPNP